MSKSVALRCALVGAASLAFGLPAVTAVASPITREAAPAPGSPQAQTVHLATSGYRDTLVDAAHHRLFFAGSKPGSVVYTEMSGANPQTVANATSGGAMAMSPDGSALYVLGTAAVEVIDIETASPEVVADYPISEHGCLSDIAATTGQVWVSYSCTPTHETTFNFLAMDVTDGSMTEPVLSTPAGGQLSLASVPGAPTELAVLNAGDIASGTQLTMYTAAGDTLTTGPGLNLGYIEGGAVALDADGSKVLAGGDNVVKEFRTDSLSLVHRFSLQTPHSAPGNPTSGVATSVAFSPDASTVAVTGGFGEDRGSTSYAYGAVVQTYREVSGSLIRRYDYRQFFTDTDVVNETGPDSLEWVGSTLWATFVNYLGKRPTAHVLTDAKKAPSTIKLDGPKSHARAKPIVVTGTVRDLVAGLGRVRLTVHRADLGGTHILAAVTTNADGRFTIHDTPRIGGTDKYIVGYAGDAQHSPAEGSFSVQVSRVAPALTISTHAKVYVTGHRARVTAHLGHTYRGRTVSISVAQYPGKYVHVRTGKVDRHGDFSVAPVLESLARFKVTFAGDERYGPRAATVVAPVRADVSMHVSQSYATSGSYHLFHKRKGARLLGTSHPADVFDSMVFQLEVYYEGKWRTGNSKSFHTDRHGHTAPIRVLGDPQYSYRLRALSNEAYVNSKVTLRQDRTGWYYLRFA